MVYIFLELLGKDFYKLESGLRLWDRVEFHDTGLRFNSSDSNFMEYLEHYTDDVPRALHSAINTLTSKGDVNVWTIGNGKLCEYKEYVDKLLLMSKIHRCEVVYYRNGICSNKDLGRFLENKNRIKYLYEKHCWGKICRYRILWHYGL